MSYLNSPLSPSRRSFLQKAAGGFGGLALSSMLSASGGLSSGTHFPAKAKRVIQIFCSGGLSHVDFSITNRNLKGVPAPPLTRMVNCNSLLPNPETASLAFGNSEGMGNPVFG